ncbi:sugar 3,4-ketoisomerase [Aquimarina rhabdastrellae]
MQTTIQECKLITIPKIEDPRGNLSVIEKDTNFFEAKRVYYLYDVPSGAKRGGHAHIEQYELLVALSGSFDVIIDDGEQKQTITLNRPDKGLYITKGIWRELENFSAGSVCLVLASDVFEEEDYIREYDRFLSFKDISS